LPHGRPLNDAGAGQDLTPFRDTIILGDGHTPS
jgi:hypothetical protein